MDWMFIGIAIFGLLYLALSIWLCERKYGTKRVKHIKPIINLWEEHSPLFTMSANYYLMMLPGREQV